MEKNIFFVLSHASASISILYKMLCHNFNILVSECFGDIFLVLEAEFEVQTKVVNHPYDI